MFLIYSFLAGFIIPFIAVRFGKILPATTGEILVQLWHRPHLPKIHNPLLTVRLKHKWIKLFCAACIYGFVYSLFSYCAPNIFPQLMVPYALTFAWFVLTLIATDFCCMLLPDCLTIPLLILAFLFSVQTNMIPPIHSLYGIIFAYVLITISTFILSFYKKDFFGGGDSKMMLAIGAWLGIQGLNYTLLLSFVLFAIYALIKRQKAGPYGPALGIAALISFLIIYGNL